MIEIQRDSFPSERLRRIDQMLASAPMLELRQALVAESDALLAEAGQALLGGARAEAQIKIDKARDLRTTVSILDQCASQEFVPASVKILTKP